MPAGSREGREVAGPRHGRAGPVLRAARSLLTFAGRMVLLAAGWPLAHHRATAAFRRALRQAGLPREAVARLTGHYAAAGSPRQLLRLLRQALRPQGPADR